MFDGWFWFELNPTEIFKSGGLFIETKVSTEAISYASDTDRQFVVIIG